MKLSAIVLTFLFLAISPLKADEIPPKSKTFSKTDISKLSSAYINNNLSLKKPVIVDVDEDGDFDILKFTSKGNVEYYKNTGTLESPFFILENKKYDSYEINTFLPSGLMLPVFFADKDGDKDKDVFAVVKEDNKYEVMYIENTMDLDHYTLITIILVLLVVVLLIVILK